MPAVSVDRIEARGERGEDGLRIGLLADTHDDLVPWAEVRARIAGALDGVDAILHCGDLTTGRALRELGEIAPVLAVRSAADPDASPPALCDGPRIVQVGALAVGLVNTLSGPPVGAALGTELRFPELAPERVAESLFGRPVEVIVYGGSHVACVSSAAGILFVNPGSPSLAKETTLGVLAVHGRSATARIVPVA
jgi:hypothetical protein